MDDDEEVRNFLKRFLEYKGHEVITANGGKEAPEKINEIPEVVLLDIMMGDIHGMNVLDRIKEIAPSTEIIMVTGLVEHAVGVESFKRGASDFITKPIDLKYLEELIDFKIMQRSLEAEP